MSSVSIPNDHKRYFLLDLSWHLYRSYYSFGFMSAYIKGMTKPTGHIYGVLKVIMDLKKKDPGCVIVLCEDGLPIKRKSSDDNYKSGRPTLEYNLYQDIPDIVKMAYKIPDVYLSFNPDFESDDIMYALARKIEKENPSAEVFIFSGDDDLLQAITERICVIRELSFEDGYKKIDEYFVTTDKRMLSKYRGCRPKDLPIFRSIIGDKSDNLKGFERFPKELAVSIAQACGNVEDIKSLELKGLTEAKRKHFRNVLNDLDRVRHNFNMMALSEDTPFWVERDESFETSLAADELIMKFRMSALYKFLMQRGLINI